MKGSGGLVMLFVEEVEDCRRRMVSETAVVWLSRWYDRLLYDRGGARRPLGN
jgi:hypothetical protein